MYFRVLLASVRVVGELNEVTWHWVSFNLALCSSDGSPVTVFHSLYNFVLFNVVWCRLVLVDVV